MPRTSPVLPITRCAASRVPPTEGSAPVPASWRIVRPLVREAEDGFEGDHIAGQAPVPASVAPAARIRGRVLR
jgi:hypothetical protein